MTNQARSPFLALVKLEVMRSSTIYGNPLAWVLAAVWLGFNLVPALLLWRKPELPLFLLLQEAWVNAMMGWWLMMLIMECSNSLVRGVWGFLSPLWVPPGAHADEFLYSRAIDRALHFRAKTVMLVVLLVVPMVLNFGLICLVTRQYPPGFSDFLKSSYANQSEAPAAAIATAFAWAMIWLSITSIVLAQGYYGVVSTLIAKRGTLRAALIACLPVLLAMGGFWVFNTRGAWESDWDHDRIAPAVRFIARYWLVLTLALLALAWPVQRFCERRFADQEVL